MNIVEEKILKFTAQIDNKIDDFITVTVNRELAERNIRVNAKKIAEAVEKQIPQKVRYLQPSTVDTVMGGLKANKSAPEVDWTKVPIDTPVLVSNDKKIWVRRHFATPALKNDDSFTVRTFADGKTEWSSTAMREEELESCERWRYAKLAEV